jgi:hypothetical protein
MQMNVIINREKLEPKEEFGFIKKQGNAYNLLVINIDNTAGFAAKQTID